jgi:hypothetical protein
MKGKQRINVLGGANNAGDGFKVGDGALGGTLTAKVVGGKFGNRLVDGTLFSKEAGKNVAYKVINGTVYVGKAESIDISKVGVKKPTLLFEECDDYHCDGVAMEQYLKKIIPKLNIFQYSKERNSYFTQVIRESTEVKPVTKKREHKKFIKKKAGLSVVDNPVLYDKVEQFTQGMKNGVLVFKKLPENYNNIADGLEGGIVIIEDPKHTTIEAERNEKTIYDKIKKSLSSNIK